MLYCFDYDGVIADSFEPLLRVCVDAKATFEEGRDPVSEDFRTIRNLTFDALGQMIGIPETKCAAYADKVFEIQKQGLKVDPFPAVVDMIKTLAAKHTVTVVTNSQSHIVASALDGFGLGKAVTAVKGGESGSTKCDRIRGFQRAYAFSAESTYMIGDTVGDIVAGKQAGVKTVAVAWGFQSRELLLAEEPDHLIEHPNELLAIAHSHE